MTRTAAHPTPTSVELPEPPFAPSRIEGLLVLLGKAVRAHQLYLQNNPVYQRAIASLRSAFDPIWQEGDEIVLAVSETDFRWYGRPVLVESDRSGDSLPWLFYKDGIREITLRRGFEEEVVDLLDLVQRVRHASPDEDDLLTLLWERDFLHLRYRFVDLALEATAPLEMETTVPSEVRQVDVQAVQEDVVDSRRAGVVRLEDFDTTLYFLDEREIEYLRNEVRVEYESDLRRNVLAILFDLYEQQTVVEVRDEIAGIVDSFMVHLLSAGQFRAVAYLLHEALVTVERSRTLTPEQRARFTSLADRLSQPEAVGQLLEALDHAGELPPQAELSELFDLLRGGALGTVLAWIGRMENPRVRVLLEGAASRLAASNTAELVRLVQNGVPAVSLEAVRRAGALKASAAVPALASKLGTDADPAVRLAAVQALAEIASAGAMQALEKAVDDAVRDVRVAAARAIAARTHRAALPRIEAAVRSKQLRDADLTEKMAFFEAYGTLSGEGGVVPLDAILNGRGFLGRREDAEMRACAAMALGKIGTGAALDAVRRAQQEKEVLVRNAVNRVLRGASA